MSPSSADPSRANPPPRSARRENFRALLGVVAAVETIEGEDMPVRRSFPQGGFQGIDPFLVFDHFGPVRIDARSAGLPPHPHRGFETVTYMLEGVMEHRDTTGGRARIGPGDVQWMTAGSGIVHAETPPEDFKRLGGTVEGFQIWVNLPRAKKMTAPGYQLIEADRLAISESTDGVIAKVIAGSAAGVVGPVHTRFPVICAHYVVPPGRSVVETVPRSMNAVLYAISGDAVTGPDDTSLGAAHMAVFDRKADYVGFGAPETAQVPAHLLLLAGEPLDEPVFAYGPFVMNSREEVVQAIEDYRSGRMGFLDG